MSTKRLTLLLFAAALVCVASFAPALADRRGGEALRRAVESGQLLPLEQILARIENVTGGRILEIELEEDDDVAVYEIYFLDANGRRQEIKVRASDAVILEYDREDDDDGDDD